MPLDIPNRLFFSYSFACRYRKKAPRVDTELSDWGPEFRVPDIGFLEDMPKVADVYMGWNEEGLYFGLEVRKRKAVRCDYARHWIGDSFQIWIDTRDVKTARRAGRYCHQFNCLPAGGGEDGDRAVVKPTQIDRARERWNMPEPETLPVAAHIDDKGYRMEVAIPAPALTGYDPSEFPRLGFTYYLNNSEWPPQWWSAGRDLRVFLDPSTWGTVTLVK
ncbi:MAG: hypothetical protein FJY97_06670 [candidate division Zixibacteria bacterium]|nr:hypothetical protein [candidate division Zixibacteria bacterium]